MRLGKTIVVAPKQKKSPSCCKQEPRHAFAALRRPYQPVVEGEQQQGGLGALLVAAIIKQVLASTFDNSHKYSGIATERLLATGEKSNGLLFGPRSPNYGKD